jgi:hypothetical protein
MADYKQCFMVCKNLCQAHLQGVGLMQILADHVSFYKNGFPFSHSWALDESQRPSQLHGHGL